MKQLAEWEWNFSKLPVVELVACCYWEYARESNSIRGAVKVVKTACTNQGMARPESQKRKRFRSAADKAFGLLHSTGFDISFWLGLPFPKPWHSLPDSKRPKNFKPEIPMPEKIPPFRVTGSLSVARAIRDDAEHVQKARLAAYQRLWEIDQAMGNSMEADDLRKQLAAPLPPPIVRGEGGVDSFIAQVNWQDFTDEEIVAAFKQWVKDKNNRPVPVTAQPKGVRGITGGRGHDKGEWRASLARLGIMRLMHHYSFDEMFAALPVELADREKYCTKAGCKKERQKALDDFHELFPYLSDEKPASWEWLPGVW